MGLVAYAMRRPEWAVTLSIAAATLGNIGGIGYLSSGKDPCSWANGSGPLWKYRKAIRSRNPPGLSALGVETPSTPPASPPTLLSESKECRGYRCSDGH